MIEKVLNKMDSNTIPSVGKICQRCMGNKIIQANNHHLYCEECYENRLMSDYLFLKRYKRIRKQKKHQVKTNLVLSKDQLKGQYFVETCYLNKENGFLHAVCGAGKTEMCLSTIEKALNDHKSLVFIIPRVEIIKQVLPRLKSYFPKTNICGLYQDMVLDESADLYISTPQQMIHFYQEFDIIFIDEVDAFPFFNNTFLERLVKKSLKPAGIKIYISATMPWEYKKLIREQNFNYCLIASRYHGKDMVLPEFRKYSHIFFGRHLKEIEKYLNNETRLIIYFPSIQWMNRFYLFLISKKISCQKISSQTQYKKGLIKDFEQGQCNILLSTTLLERGVTFSNCDVFVLESDHVIFDKDTLTQISGRVGRNHLYPKGQLIFYSSHISLAMEETKKELKRLNKVKNNDL